MNRTKTLESLQATLERKAEEFDRTKESSIESVSKSIQELKKLVEYVENSIISEIEEAFEVNRFAEALGNISEYTDNEIPKDELERLRGIARIEVVSQIGPCRRDFLRVQEKIIGLGNWSGEKPLNVPAHVKGRCCDADSVEVVWDRVEKAMGYHVEMRRPNEGAFRRVYEGSETKYKVSGLCSGTRLLFRVRSVLGNGVTSEWSECVEACSPSCGVQYLCAEAVSESEIAVTWDGVDGPEGEEALTYHVEMRLKNQGGKGDTRKFKEVYCGSETMYTVAGLESEEEYLFSVRTMCGDRCIGRSCLVTARTKIAAPKRFRARTDSWDSINLSWCCVSSKRSDCVNYIVEMRKGDSEFVEIYRGGRTKIKKRMIEQDTEYSFRVRSAANGEVSEWSEVASARTQKLPDISEWAWKKCPDHVVELSRKYSVNERNPRVATKVNNNGWGNNSYCTIIGSMPLPANQVTSWSIKILKSRGNDGDGIYIGVAPSDINQSDKDNYNRCGWYFRCYGSTLCSGPPQYYTWPGKTYGLRKEEGEYVHTGDSVGVVMDTAKGELSFVVNGVNLGVAFEGNPLDKPLVPCVLLGYKGDSIELDTSEVKENVDSSILVPSNITTKSITWDSITLTWDAAEGASFYQIEADGSKLWGASTANRFTQRGLLPDTEHTFRIRVVRGDSVSEWSDAVRGRAQKKSFETSGWKECPDDVDVYMKYFVVEKNSRIATKIDGGGCCTIIGSTPLPFNKVASWSIKILKSRGNDGNGIYIGVAPSDINQSDKDNYNRCGWYFYCFDSRLCSGPPHDYSGKEYGPRKGWRQYVHTGDSVGVVMDTAKGELSFVVGGVNLGVAFEGIPLDKPLVPCALLCREGDSVELDTSEVKENAVDSSIPIPSNITTKSTTWDSITLTWDAAEGASFYQIEADGSKLWGASTANRFTQRGLLPDTEHTFRIRVVRGDSVSEWSDAVRGRAQKKSFETSGWKECPDDVDERMKYSVDGENPRVTTMKCDDYCTIIGDTPLPLNKVASWSIKVLRSKENDGAGIYIGVAPSDIDQNKNNFNICGWYFGCYLSALFSGPPHNYWRKEYGPRKVDGEYVHTGDSVGVVMDTAKGELSFVVGGVNLGVAYEGIPLNKPLVPCVILCREGDSVGLDTSEVKETNVDSSIPVPSNITAKSGIAWDSITLTWDAVERASFYQVEVDRSKFWGASTTNAFMKVGLLPGTEHTFRIRAVRGNSVSEWSDAVKGRTQKKSFETSRWKECPEYINEDRKYSVDEENPRIATKIGGDDYCTIIGNAPLPLNAVTSWSIRILESKKNNGYGIYIGVAPSDIDQNEDNSVNKYWWYFNCYRSNLRSGPPHKYIDKEYGPRKGNGEYVHTGDSIGVVMDTAKGKLSFVVNGVNLNVAREGIPFDKPLVPCVILGNKGDSVELDLSEVKENVDSSINISSITAKSTTWDSIILTWDAVERASFYQIEVDGSRSWDASTTNTFTKRGLLPETEHIFRVRAVRGNFVSEWSDVVKEKTQKVSFETSGWKECPGYCGRNYSVYEENSRIASSSNDSYCTIIGNTPLPLNKVVLWKIKLLLRRDTGNRYIGVAPFDIDQNEDYNYKKCGWYFNNLNGTLSSGHPHNFRNKKCKENIQTGDSVGVVMDTIKGELSFVLNGVNLGVAYEGIPLDKPLVPCVLIKGRCSVELII